MIHIYCQHSLAAFTAMHFHHKRAVFNANKIFMMICPGKPFSTNFIPIYTNKPINAYHIKHSFKMETQTKREAKRKNTMIRKTSESKIRDFFAQTGNKVEHLLNVTQEHKVVIVVENAD